MFGRKNEPPVTAAEPVVPEVKEEPKAEVFRPAEVTRIGQGITMVGNFETKDPIELNGIIRGNINSTSSVSISENGALYGEAKLAAMKVSGRIDGSIICENVSEFSSTGSMKGNLSTGTLKTADGSLFEGKLNMTPRRRPAEAQAAPAAPAKPAEDASEIAPESENA